MRQATQILTERKSKLFESRAIEKWGTNSKDFVEPLDKLMKDFSLASKYILPKETDKLEIAKELQQNISASVYHEYILFNKRDQKRIVKNFREFAKKVGKSTQSKEVIWNIFERIELPEAQSPQVMQEPFFPDTYLNQNLATSQIGDPDMQIL